MSKLTLQELKKLYPGIYAEAIADGVARERERCSALMPEITAYTTPITAYAIKCVKEGVDMGDLQKATYLSMKINEHNKKAKRERDSEMVVSMVERRFGVDRNENDYH